MELSVMRASARAGEVRPSKFGDLARAIDQAEGVAWDRIGGPTDAECAAIRRLEAALPAPVTIEDWHWLAGRFSRALANAWAGAAVDRLVRLAQ
jgi:hypothetical protein